MKIIMTDKLRESYYALLEAKAEHKKIRDELEPLEERLLVKIKLTVKEDIVAGGRLLQKSGDLITQLDDAYLACEKDLPAFYNMCHELYLEKGYKVKKYHSPILIARREYVEAESKFIDESLYLVDGTGLKRESQRESLRMIKNRREYLKLTIDLVDKIVKQEESHLEKLVNLKSKIKECSPRA